MSRAPTASRQMKGTDVSKFELTDQTGQPWQLADALHRGAVALVFYRGDW